MAHRRTEAIFYPLASIFNFNMRVGRKAVMTEGEHEQPRQSPDDEFGLSAVREVLRLIQETDITEIQIKRGDAELHIKRGGLTPVAAPLMVTPSLAAALQPTIAPPLPPIAPFQQPSHPS